MAQRALRTKLDYFIEGGQAGRALHVGVNHLAEFDHTVKSLAFAVNVLLDVPVASNRSTTFQSSSLVERDAELRSSALQASSVIAAPSILRATRASLTILLEYHEISPRTIDYQPVSDHLFPTLPGLAWDIAKRPTFSTSIAPHASGREVRASNYAYPLWIWEMSYEFLRAGAEEELQELMGFFLQRQGAYDTFLFKDPDENNELTGIVVGVGDDQQTKWTLLKAYGGFAEPCGYIDTDSVQVYFDDGETVTEQTSGWEIISPNQLSFTAAPAAGIDIIADYTWYYRVRFGDDSLDYRNFMYNVWELQSLTLQSVKP